ncbi:MAG: DNA polymerase III subunit alpha [Clostridia bacterium]|nr:DNA polymerase III subunit alpha [Clostridia bacterium]
MGFVHLHVHSQYSLLDGMCIVGEDKKHNDKMMDLLHELGQDAIAITDHGNMYSAIKFYKSAKSHGIKPILGCEVYVANRSRFQKTREFDSGYAHLVLLCENNQGYQNLIKIVSKSNLEGFYYKPRVDHELLEQYHEGLICLSACLGGEIPQLLLKGEYEEAKKLALWYQGVFGEDHYYLELQDHDLPEQKTVLDGLLRLHEETGIPLVATNDAHYMRKSDAKAQKVLLYVQIKKTINEECGMGFETDEFYVKSEDEMRSLFEYVPEACDNTVKIANMCNVSFKNLDDPDHKEYHLPDFRLPDGKDHYEFLRELAYEGFDKKYPERTPELIERLEYELSVVHKMGFVDYFLIVSDYVRFAKRSGIPVGPGRGSGAGSIVAYCIEITNIEPIKYNLLFERFLNPERVSMPDFDVDFCVDRRQEVVDYCINKYGAKSVAQIVTFGTMKAKMAVKDVARVLEFTPQEANAIAKLLQDGMKIMESVELVPELRTMYQTDPRVKELIDLSAGVENAPRHTSVHACGVVITYGDVSDYVPLAIQDDMPVTQYDMIIDEELGLLKMDFLGLRNLTVIEDACVQIRKKVPAFNINTVDMDDAAVYGMLSNGYTDGVFQLESGGMKKTLIQLQPKNIEDITAVISLYRPGPMESIPAYVFNSNHPDKITYKHESLRPILEVTSGCLVYQEQVMQVVRELAGYSFGRADVVRRAMGKKKMEVMQQEREYFVNGKFSADGTMELPGAVRNGVPAEIANAIFDEMIDFAKYAFNKSHAAAYAFVTYYTAFLKCHYPQEYMSALLTSVLDKTDKMVGYINECKRMGIRVLAPDINESEVNFSVAGNDIRYGLSAVKNVGKAVVEQIINERVSNGPFMNFYEFCERMMKASNDIDSRTVESLILCGAFDSFGLRRKQLISAYADIRKSLQVSIREEQEGQISLFGISTEEERKNSAAAIYRYPDVPEYSKKELLTMEKQVTGLYLSDHPMNEYESMFESTEAERIAAFNDEDNGYQNNQRVRAFGILTKVTRKMTKNETMMAVLQLEDLTGAMEVLVFGKAYERLSAKLIEDDVVIITGKLSIEDSLREDDEGEGREAAKLIAQEIDPVRNPNEPMVIEQRVQTEVRQLFVQVNQTDAGKINETVACLQEFPGNNEVFFYFPDSKKQAKFTHARVDLSWMLLSRLKGILGDRNVAIKVVKR